MSKRLNKQGMKRNSFGRYRPLIHELVIRDLKLKYQRSFLGYLWSLLNPLLMMLILNLVFGHVFRFGINNFPLYLICGQTLFNFFSESTGAAMTSVINNASLIRKIYVPGYVFPLTRIVSCFVNMSFSLVAIVLVMCITGARFYWTILTVVFPVLFLFLFCCGTGMLLSALTVFFRDLIHLWNVATLVWLYLTPVFYTPDMLPENVRQIVAHNPLYFYITFFRCAVMQGVLPGPDIWIGCILSSLLSLFIGLMVFRKLKERFILYI